jgi:hypothetical protein
MVTGMSKYIIGNFVLFCINLLLLAAVAFATMDQSGIDEYLLRLGIFMAILTLIYNLKLVVSQKKRKKTFSSYSPLIIGPMIVCIPYYIDLLL